MRIGDKVRLLRGTEEGRIVDIKDNKIVDIEIEDGFVIPALINEVVLIHKSEAESFHKDEVQIESTKEDRRQQDFISEGVYLGFDTIKLDEFIGYIVNQTKSTVLYSISQFDKKKQLGRSYGICENYEIKEIGNFTPSIFNDSKKLHIELIFHEQEIVKKKQPLILDVTLSRDSLNEKVYIDSISKEIALINFSDNQKLEIDAQALQDKMMESNLLAGYEKKTEKKQSSLSIDLHVDVITTGLNSNEILEYQLNEFEKAFDNALVMNCENLKVIHGIGAGILRNEIHKRLSKKPSVKFFEDADKERFGFGSTIIYF